MEEPQQNFEKIHGIQLRFSSILDDFKKYYVYFNKNPEVNEFQNYYANSKGQIQTISRDVFMTTNNINKSIEELDKNMYNISVKLDHEKTLNKEMTELLNNLQNTQDGSEILISDSKTNYNTQYYKNWEIFIGMLIMGGMLGTLFKPKPPV